MGGRSGGDVLDEIVAGVREDVAARQARLPLDELKAGAAAARPALDALAALRAPGSVSSPRSSAAARPRARWPTIADPAAAGRASTRPAARG